MRTVIAVMVLVVAGGAAWPAAFCSEAAPYGCGSRPWPRRAHLLCLGSDPTMYVTARVGGRRVARIARAPLPAEMARCEAAPDGCVFDVTGLCATRIGPCTATRVIVPPDGVLRVRRSHGLLVMQCPTTLDPFIPRSAVSD